MKKNKTITFIDVDGKKVSFTHPELKKLTSMIYCNGIFYNGKWLQREFPNEFHENWEKINKLHERNIKLISI